MARYRAVRVSADHPLAIRNASYQPGPHTVQIWAHRKVLFDKIGYGPHWCHWCGKNVNWRPGKKAGGGNVLVCDHVDRDCRNNVPENLVPSCAGCNAHRNHPVPRIRDDEATVLLGGKRTRAVAQTCRQCGAEFLVAIALVRQGKGIYCSRLCWARS